MYTSGRRCVKSGGGCTSVVGVVSNNVRSYHVDTCSQENEHCFVLILISNYHVVVNIVSCVSQIQYN